MVGKKNSYHCFWPSSATGYNSHKQKNKQLTARVNKVDDGLGAHAATELDHVGTEEDQVVVVVLAVLGEGELRVVGQLEGELEAASPQRPEEVGVGLADGEVVEQGEHARALAVRGYARGGLAVPE